MHFGTLLLAHMLFSVVVASASYVVLATAASARRERVASPASLPCGSPYCVLNLRMRNFIPHNVC